MLGAAGAVCCLTAGTALGSYLREKRMARLRGLMGAAEMLSAMRLLLETERLPLPDLLEACADRAGGEALSGRLMAVADALRTSPLTDAASAYRDACLRHPAPWEQAEEKAALEGLFRQLGTGSAAMREQAAAACIRRLKPLCDQARQEAEKGGKLCMQLGMLLGLMAGIALW